MAATSALGFEPVLSELGTEAVRVPPVLLKLEEEGEKDEEMEEEEETDEEVLLSTNFPRPNCLLASMYQSSRNLTRKSVLIFLPLASALIEA